jgi:AcrR family transcriptional regulator
MAATTDGRRNQRLRTRNDLLKAAARLLKAGGVPTMDAVAAEALVSRATAYRYFPNLDALLFEAPLDEEAPTPETVFEGVTMTDPVDRIDRAEAALHLMTCRNEAQLRAMLAHTLSGSSPDGAVPQRQNRRMPLIEAALAPVKDELDAEAYDRLCKALAVFFGPEALVVFRDVLGVKPAEARRVKQWALAALVRAARAEG